MLRIVTFGEATISVGGEQVAPSAHRMFALALYLVAERGRAIPRALLQAQLFSDSDERAGSHNLRQLVYRLRQLGAPVVTTPSTLGVAPEHAIADYVALLETPSLTGDQLDLVAKGFLPGYSPLVSDAYLEWVDAFRGRITLALRRKALEAMAAARDRCDWPGVARAADACLALDPLNEDAILGHAEALAMSGSKAEALERIERYLSELPPSADDCRSAARRLRQRIMRRVAEPAPLALREMPLVGREEEMRRLTAALARTRSEGGGVVLISGEPGIGKTRLLTEFERLAGLSGAQTARVVCRASTAHQPLSPFIELTRMLLQMRGALGCSPEALERLKTLCLVPSSPPRLTSHLSIDPDGAFDGTARALLDLIESVAAESPLLLMIDDAQWLDAASEDIVRHLAGMLQDAPVLMVLGSRDSAMPRLPRDDRRLELLSLPRLSNRLASSLLSRSIQHDLAAVDLENLTAIASGNPLLVRLVASQFGRTRGLEFKPVAVTDLYARRLDLLTPDARGLLEYAVLLGRNASLRRVQETLGLTTASFVAALRELDTLGLLQVESDLLCPSHTLVTDVVLRRISPSIRKVLHRRAASHLAQEYVRTGEADVLWDCTDHWEQSGDAVETVSYLRQCAAHSLSLGRAEAAQQTLQRALRTRPLSAQLREDLLNEAVSVCEISGQWDEIGKLIEAAGVPVCTATDKESLSEPDIVGLDALRIIGTLGPFDPAPVFQLLRSRRCARLARLRAAVFLVSLADEVFDQPLASAVRDVVGAITATGDDEQNLKDKYLLIDETAFGDIGTARVLGLRAVASLTRDGVQLKHVNQCFALAYSLLRCGADKQANELLTSLLPQLRSWKLHHQEIRCRSYLAWVALRHGHATVATEHHAEALAMAMSSAVDLPLLMHSNAVELAILTGRFTDALMETDRAAARFRSLRQGKMRLELLQLTIRARAGAGMPLCTSAELHELYEGHLLGRTFGLQDDTTEALALALCAFGRAAEARQLVTAYITTYRRDPLPISDGLQKVAAKIAGEDCTHVGSRQMPQMDVGGSSVPTGWLTREL